MRSPLQIEETFVEAGDSPPTYFDVVFYPDCKITARIDASTKEEAMAIVQASLSQWENRLEDGNAEEATSVPKWFADASVNIQLDSNNEHLIKMMTACQVSSLENLEYGSVLDIHPLTLEKVSHQPSRSSLEKEGQDEL